MLLYYNMINKYFIKAIDIKTNNNNNFFKPDVYKILV